MARHLSFLALSFLCLIPWPARAEIHVAAACRVRNLPPGRCGWCALETLARYHGLHALYGLARSHPSRCRVASLEHVLTHFGIHYRIQYHGVHDTDILRYAIDEDLGAAVGLRESYPGAGGHIVTLVDFTATRVKIIDSNDADIRTQTLSLGHFLSRWDGFALVLEPELWWTRRNGTEAGAGTWVALPPLSIGLASLDRVGPREWPADFENHRHQLTAFGRLRQRLPTKTIRA